MATISGKRFQIDDGASTPTNLFPYTVTEAVYGLSTVIENAKTAVTSVLSAVTLNGVSKAGTTASFYAPTTAGTAGQILTSLGSGAPAWTSVARGASNKPIYINSSGVLTEGESCLPLTGGTISNGNTTEPLAINSTGGTVGMNYKLAGSNKVWVGHYYTMGAAIYNYASAKYLGIKDDGTPHYQGNTLYHSGNSNKSDVPWTCSTLTASGDTFLSYTSDNGGLRTTTSGGYTYIQVKAASANAGSLHMCGFNGVAGNKAILNFNYVGIGTTSPSQKLDVRGTIISIGTNAGYLLYPGWASGESLRIATCNTSGTWQTNAIFVMTNGDVGIGGTPSSKLYVAGAITSTGDQVVSSDLTLKENLTPVTYSVSDIAKARAVEFDWKDGRGHSMGSIAQDWLGIAPALVHGKEGNMSLAYGQLALVNTIIEAREIETLKARVAELEAEVKRLRMN